MTLRADAHLFPVIHDLMSDSDADTTFMAEIHHIGYMYRTFFLDDPALAFGIRFLVSLDQVDLFDDDPFSVGNGT